MRGLKQRYTNIPDYWDMSHLLQMRGLKLANRLNQLVVYNVASFTDAWIETEKKEEKNIGNDSRIFYRCVD